MTRVLITDDDADVLRALQRILAAMQLEVVCAEDGLAAQTELANAEFDLIITDLVMPRADGFAVLDAARARWPATPVLILTGQGTTADCVRALRAGAFNFVGKPFDPADLTSIIADALRSRSAEADSLSPALALRTPQAALVGESRELGAVLDQVERAANVDSAVLLRGEKGTGKEAVARLLHVSSRRAGGPFVVVRCGALPAEQLERELFGHDAEPGKLEQARGGTLLLAELDRLDLALQGKLARVLVPEQPFIARGLDLRVIAGIDRALREQPEAGPLAAALEANLGGIVIEMPALRDRSEDMPLLVEYLVEAANHRLGRRAKAEALLSALQSYSWPGNLAELETRVERFVATAPPEPSYELGRKPHAINVLAVPVERFAATLVLQNGASCEVLLSCGLGHPVEDVFSAKEPFLAVQESGRTRIYARSALACIHVQAAQTTDEDSLPLRHQPVSVRLSSGTQIEGELRYVAVEGRARATDVLNEEGPSFSLYAGDRVSHVAKAHVLSVEER